jgi:hypothetical protein
MIVFTQYCDGVNSCSYKACIDTMYFSSINFQTLRPFFSFLRSDWSTRNSKNACDRTTRRMASPTRHDFLNYVHTPLTNPNGDPPPGSPTKSTMRYRWRGLHRWDVEADANAYWDVIPDDDKDSTLAVQPGYWQFVAGMLPNPHPYTSESTLRLPFGIAYLHPHNAAIQSGSDAHAQMWPEGSGAQLARPPIAPSGFLFVHDGRLTGIIELKCWWKVTEAQFDAVKESTYMFTYES